MEVTERQRRLIDAALILGVVVLTFIVLDFAANVLAAFGDVILTFFLAWLLSFALLPLINVVQLLAPRLPRAAAVVVVYVTIIVIVVGLLIQASSTLATSIGQLIADAPQLQTSLERFLHALEMRLAAFGFNVDLVSQAPEIVRNLQAWAVTLVGPLQSIALASIGVIGNVIIIFVLSLYVAIDRASILAFLYRLVPPGFATEARLLQVSVGKSFGGFLRGQLILGVSYGAVAALTSILLGLDYGPVSTVATGVLHAIPFFGPFLSWAPPIIVAILTKPEVLLPAAIIMGIGWVVTMNVLQPRLMADSVGIHPIVVLGSVVVGSKIAGIAGAIFGIPIAAVISAFFFHWYGRSRENGTVAERAAKRIEARERRPVRTPREPVAGVDEDVVDPDPTTSAISRPSLPDGEAAR
jgi:predicted PurR-regulated permease PerM